MLTPNYAINPTPEQALRSNRAVLPARVIAALGLMRLGEACVEGDWSPFGFKAFFFMTISSRVEDSLPEIFCDLNAGATLGTFRLTNGSFADLYKIGLTVDEAVGKRFLFNAGDDTDEDGMLADVCFVGTVVNDPVFGYLAKVGEGGIFWRRK